SVHVTTETWRGFQIAFFRVYPLLYVGAERKLLFSPKLDVVVETAPRADALEHSRGTFRSAARRDLEEVARMVDNLAAASTYAPAEEAGPRTALVDPSETYPCVVITIPAFQPAFGQLAEARARRGLRTRVVLKSEILAAYGEGDTQQKIRDFIRDAYLWWKTEFVLLGGDDNFLPHRGLYAEVLPYVTDGDIPADLYYAALDGDWNDDGDDRWGEPGEADLMPEVSVGRASVGSLTEAANFVGKLIRYESAPVAGQIKIAQMAGELVYDEPTWGGDEKDEVKYGSAAHGFTTAGFPPSFTVHTLYDRDLYPAQWSKHDLIALMNGGRHLINHAGHCINWMCLRIPTSDIPTSFTNDGIANSYFVIYAHGCYSAAFDNRTTDGSYVGDAVAEYFTFIENGAVAYIGNSRYGCGFHGDTRSAAQYYDRQFFDALFGEGITRIGRAQDDSKIDNIPYIDFRGMRWTYYTLNLIGDPAMDIWTDVPGTLVVEGPDVIRVSENEIAVLVTDGAAPVEGARVTLFGDSSLADWALTNEEGEVHLDPCADDTGSLFLAVDAHDFYFTSDTIRVAPSLGPLLVVERLEVDDDQAGGSNGDSDGLIDAGETVEILVTIRNIGQAAAANPAGALRTDDSCVVMIDSGGACGDIPPGAVGTPPWGCTADIAAWVPDSHVVHMELGISYSDTSVTRQIELPISAPSLRVAEVLLSDTLDGNSDGCVEPGEGLELILTLANNGSGEAAAVNVILSESDPHAALGLDSAFVPFVPAGGSASASPAFFITVAPGCPVHHRIDLAVSMELANGRRAAGSVAVHVGGAVEDGFEEGSPGWSHEEIIKGFIDQWHVEDYRNHTPGGAWCWKFGGPGEEGYAHYAHGALVTPELCLGPNAVLSFWHLIRAELAGGGYASDGGIVEISTDRGETWVQLTPVGGYPYRICPGTSTPIPPETPCFAWTSGWTQSEFDLSAHEGSARIRFNFGGGEHFGSEEGWYVDDVTVGDDYTSVAIDEDLVPAPRAFALRSVRPNPVASDLAVLFDVPHHAEVTIKLYDVGGRYVATLFEGFVDPGSHLGTLAGGRLAGVGSGVYFMRMKAGSFEETKRIVLLR
ncbi:MAG: C25 family cysteine peptidase, partial [Candidatus Eisenbacteria bacterium]